MCERILNSFHFCLTPPNLLSFVSDVVHIYYTDNEAVLRDVEIQAFVKDVCSFGMQDFAYCGGFTRTMASSSFII